MAAEIVTSDNREDYMAKKLGTPMSKRKAPIHMGNWMKKYKEYEDKNYHSENVVRLANLVGHNEHHQEAMDIMKRHHERGHMNDEDYKRRNEIDKEHYPKALSMHEEWEKTNK